MAAITKSYRIDGTDEYRLEFRPRPDGTYRIRCLAHPHNPYDPSVVKCHLHADGYVCIADGKEPRTLDQAKAVAFLFMKGYSRYVRTGEFGRTGGRVNV